LEQSPVAVSHVPAVWHWSGGGQIFTAPPTHAPPWQVSPRVQRLPSSQLVPSSLGGLLHCPVAESQAPGRWHWSEAWHTTAVPAVQLPPWQVSPVVQGLPASHAVPLALAGLVQAPE